jgi:hypothetical protein
MNGEIGNGSELQEVDSDFQADDDIGLSLMSADDDDSDNVGDLSVEINVDDLVAKIESRNGSDAQRRREVRRRLEALREQREAQRDLDDTFDFCFDEEI